MNYNTKEDIAILCAKVHHNNSCDTEVWELVNTLYGFEKADKICLALDDNDVCPNCIFYNLHFSSGIERGEQLCSNQKSCCCGNHVTRDFSCKFFEPVEAIRDNIHKSESPLGSNFETHKTNDGFIHVHKRAKDFSVTDTIRPGIDMTKLWGEPSNKYGALVYSAQRNSDYTISLYTGGGDKLPTCTLCGTTMHGFSSCSNKNCLKYKKQN